MRVLGAARLLGVDKTRTFDYKVRFAFGRGADGRSGEGGCRLVQEELTAQAGGSQHHEVCSA